MGVFLTVTVSKSNIQTCRLKEKEMRQGVWELECVQIRIKESRKERGKKKIVFQPSTHVFA